MDFEELLVWALGTGVGCGCGGGLVGAEQTGSAGAVVGDGKLAGAGEGVLLVPRRELGLGWSWDVGFVGLLVGVWDLSVLARNRGKDRRFQDRQVVGCTGPG